MPLTMSLSPGKPISVVRVTLLAAVLAEIMSGCKQRSEASPVGQGPAPVATGEIDPDPGSGASPNLDGARCCCTRSSTRASSRRDGLHPRRFVRHGAAT